METFLTKATSYCLVGKANAYVLVIVLSLNSICLYWPRASLWHCTFLGFSSCFLLGLIFLSVMSSVVVLPWAFCCHCPHSSHNSLGSKWQNPNSKWTKQPTHQTTSTKNHNKENAWFMCLKSPGIDQGQLVSRREIRVSQTASPLSLSFVFLCVASFSGSFFPNEGRTPPSNCGFISNPLSKHNGKFSTQFLKLDV